MHPVLFHIGGWTVYSYTVTGMLAIVAVITVAYLWLRPKGYSLTSILVLSFVGSATGLLGARLFYVIGHMGTFSRNPGEILDFQMSGLVFYGAVIVGGVAVILAARLLKMRIWEILDAAGLGLLLGLAIGRVGCFLNGCCGGKPSGLPWAVTFPGTMESVHPTQLYELGLNLIAFGLLLYLAKRLKREGEVFLLAIALYGVIRFNMEFLRVHSDPLAAPVFQLISMMLIVVSLIILVARRRLIPTAQASLPGINAHRKIDNGDIPDDDLRHEVKISAARSTSL